MEMSMQAHSDAILVLHVVWFGRCDAVCQLGERLVMPCGSMPETNQNTYAASSLVSMEINAAII